MNTDEEREREPGAEEDEEMPATERELAEDAAWKRIQQNTFTRWANEHLKTVSKNLGNLETDLADGLRLISLIEVLSGKKLSKHNKRPTFRSQKLENVSVALKFLEEDEGIRIVNIDSSDIVNCKLKLILGLIWTLILHYSISMPMWEGEEDIPHRPGESPTPKQRLLGWIQSKLPDLPVNNFTSDWNDGRAVGALVDAVAPGLCPDWQDWDPKNAKQNATEAMKLAEDWLGVPQLIRPEEMVMPKVDELSMMTYLSQFPAAKLKPGAPLRPRINPNRVRAYGPGIEPTGVSVGAPARFTVETFSAGQGKVEIFVENPKGEKEPVDVKFNNDRNLTYSVSYTPRLEGPHKVKIIFAGKEIPKSPYNVVVEGHAGDATKVTAKGPGLEPTGVMIGKTTYFEIFTKDAGRGQVEVIVLDPQGHKNSVQPVVKQSGDSVWRCDYVAQQAGLHSVNVFFAGQPIPNSPFAVKIAPVSDPKKVRASGRGLQPKGIRVRDTADFKVFTDGSGEGKLEVKVIGPGGVQEKVEMKKINETTYECIYRPMKEGKYTVIISYGGLEIPRSPFEVQVAKFWDTKIHAYGPGLESGMVGYSADFTVETNGETGALGFSIEGPSQAKIDCKDNGDGSADVKYWPTVPGDYAVHILCNEEDIPKSPYMACIQPKTDCFPDKVKAFGPGLEKSGVTAGKQTEFTVDTRQAGKSNLKITALDEDYNPVNVQVRDNKDGTYTCSYTAIRNMRHTISITYGGVAIANSPFKVYVNEPTSPNKVKVYGPGVEKGVKSGQPTHFFVDCKQAGPGDIQIALTDEKGKDVPFKITDNGDGTFKIDYSAPTPGTYKVTVFFAGREIPSSPIKVVVAAHLDVSKIKVEGLEARAFLDSTTEFTVDARSVTKKGEGKVKAVITSPSGTKTDALVTNNSDGTYKISYSAIEEGHHTIEITYDSIPIPNTPHKVNVVRGCDPSKCRAYGPGLQNGFTSQKALFTVETKGAGTGGLGLAVEGPSEAKMSCKDNRDGTCSVEYLPTEPGDYDIAIKFADHHIPGSPFRVHVDTPVDASKVVAQGPGLEPQNCRANIPVSFKVDTTKAGRAPLGVDITSDKGGTLQKPQMKSNNDGTYDVTYIPPVEGAKCTMRVTYGGKDIPKSPFQMNVLPTCEPKKVLVSGPGVNKAGVPASIPVDFVVDTKEAGFGDLEVFVQGPEGDLKKVKVIDQKDGTFKVSYTPDDIGNYNVVIKYGGQEVPNSPFQVKANPTGDATQCKITEGLQQTIVMGEECCVTVNAKQAGKGAVTCRIRSSTGNELDIDIEDNGDGTFSIFYNAKDAGEYTINVKFGGQSVPGGTYTMTATTEEIVRQTTVEQYQKTTTTTTSATTTATTTAYRPIELRNIPVSTAGGTITGEVKMPSGKTERPTIQDNKDGTVTVKYEPKEIGLHELHVKYNKEHVQGSPFKFHVDAVNSGYVTAYGSGLTHGICGEPCNFTIVTKDAGAGGLALAVEGPSKAEITCQDNKDGTCSVSYLPTAPGEYKIVIKFDDKNINGSPFSAKITGEGRKRSQISVGSSSEVSLKVTETDVKSLNASIKSPSGLEEPCFLKKLPNGHLGISFTPREKGEHLVYVKRQGVQIAGSPFKILVGESEIGDANKVKVFGQALKEGITQVVNEFTINTKEAGYGGLSLSVEGPSKADIQCSEATDGSLNVGYKPTEPGFYIINIKFADHHVPGSPFTARVSGEGTNRQTEKISRKREAVPVTSIGSECELSLKIPGTSPMDMSAQVTSPGGVTRDADIYSIADCTYTVKFIPAEMGIHTVSIKHKDLHIPGSPFQFTVGPFKDAGSHKVHAGGPGLERGEVNEPCEFNVWTREAGPGNLSIAVEGPSKAEIDFKDRKDGSCYVSYAVPLHGEYTVSVKFNDQHIPDSPFKVYVTPQLGEARRLEVAALQDSGLTINKPCAFTVVFNGAKGHLDAKVVAPSGAEDDAFLTPIDDDTYAVRFIPHENGIHYVHIRFDGVHIRGSPYRVRVGKEDADPAAVTAYGKGLEIAETGTKTEFIVNTCNAGAGTLAVTIDGPSKVSMDCSEVDDGYKVRYTPLAPGDYFITIKYSSFHIAGSPFKVQCSGPVRGGSGLHETSSVIVETVTKTSTQTSIKPVMPKFNSDASKVQSKGIGLKKAYMQKQNMFTVNCQDAGQNILLVGVYGPKHPCEEVFIKHLGRNTFQVNYVIKERGEYLILVKWGDDHIPGSPFQVVV